MARKRETVFSDALLNKVERAQRIDNIPVVNRLWRAGRSAIAGYTEPGFRYAHFVGVANISEDGEFEQLKGNPKAGPVPRLWSHVAALAMPVEVLAKAELALQQDDITAHHAVAYRKQPGAPIHAAILSSEPYTGFGMAYTNEDRAMRGAGTRQGKWATEATAALYLPETGTLVIPNGVEVLDQLVPKVDFTRRFSDLPIV